jgi:hypothetical protein
MLVRKNNSLTENITLALATSKKGLSDGKLYLDKAVIQQCDFCAAGYDISAITD